jgi:hypothetical protein
MMTPSDDKTIFGGVAAAYGNYIYHLRKVEGGLLETEKT